MDELRAPEGATRRKKIIGRGQGSGHGGTSGKGHKGQNSRSGGGVRPGFEGGQMPLYRRIARRGFSNYPFKREVDAVNVSELERAFDTGETVTLESLKEHRLIKKSVELVKILGDGEIAKKLTVDGVAISASARDKILKAGGSVIGASVALSGTAEAGAPATPRSGAGSRNRGRREAQPEGDTSESANDEEGKEPETSGQE